MTVAINPAALDAQDRAPGDMLRIWLRERKRGVLATHAIEEAIALFHRILVMSRRPGTIKADDTVGLEWPRRKDDREVLVLRRKFRHLIGDDADPEG